VGTLLVFGLLIACAFCQGESISQSVSRGEDDLFVGENSFDWGDDFNWGNDFNWDDRFEQGETTLQTSVEDTKAITEDEDGEEVWIEDENFYSDTRGSDGEELDWEHIGHPGIPGPEENGLWIVYPYSNSQLATQIVIPKGRYAKELLTPGRSGSLTVYEKYPNGDVKSYVPGWHVVEDHVYKIWFFADTVGVHTVRYKVHDEKHNVTTYSNQIQYDVTAGPLVVVVPDIKVYKNETAILTARASGGCDPTQYTYQWYEGKSSAGTLIANEVNSTYRIRGIQTSGNYTCKVTCLNNDEAEDWGLICVLPERVRTPPHT